MLSFGLWRVCVNYMRRKKKGRSALDTANKDAEVAVHLSIKGKGSSQSEHLHLCVYVQEDPSASCPWPDAQVHLLSPTRKLVAASATSITTYQCKWMGISYKFHIKWVSRRI